MAGKINLKPIHLTPTGIHDIYYHRLGVHLVPSVRKAVTGDGVCIGLTFKCSPFAHPKTARSCGLIDAIVAEVRSHPDLKDIVFT